MSYLSSAFKGLVAGSIITPIVTKVFIVPLYFDSQIHKEIHYIQQEMEYVGWHIRHLEEERVSGRRAISTSNILWSSSMMIICTYIDYYSKSSYLFIYLLTYLFICLMYDFNLHF